MDPLASAVNRSKIFQDLDWDIFMEDLRACPHRTVDEHEILIRPGQENHSVYFLITGTLSIHLEKPGNNPIRIVHPGETVGELSIIAATLSSAYVVGMERAELAVIDQSLLWDLVEREPRIARNLLLVLSGWVITGNVQTGKQMRTLETLEGLVRMDGLTGIYNRRSFDEMLKRFLTRSQRVGHPMALVLIDVDLFKRYNDTQGHQAGDQALIALARVLNDSIRPSDFAARYGGEEFAFLLADTSLEEGIMIAERVRQAVMEKNIFSQDGHPLPGITISLGLALSHPGSTPEGLIRIADQNLYRAKQEGRNRCCHHHTEE
ncbi:MAG: GGDEF domain-containing protein [Magnetococcales bacterium]|nr:GGDEF domain-containing protein [Magnetococcales bacterium]